MSLTAHDISIQGAENARIILIALFCLSDLSSQQWLITLDEEIKYFWTGPWGMSRMLFLLNRYLSPAISILALFCNCKRGIQTLFITSIVALGVVQAMLVVRVWYLFGQSRLTRMGMIVSFALTNLLSLYFAIMAGIQLEITPNLTKLHLYGCRAERPSKFWRLWLPSLVLHTLLYCLTAFRALKNRRVFKEAPILKRLVRDGGFFYFVVFISVLFTAIGSFLQQYPTINVPAIFSKYVERWLCAIILSCPSTVVLLIHSLAAKLGSNSAWLLNNIELSRVPWRQGATEGEIIVDRFQRDPDEDEYDDEPDSPSNSVVSLKMSRVGRWNDETW
ncbi:hypothetical protein B0H12DRAFT_1034789 [Mycena haematopus]|nr:hypothetical protein B0H12DRAFT_1034789 [Mycena haematopus]